MVKLNFWKIFQDFSKQTTIHGVPIIGSSRLHPLERIFWLIMISVAAFGSISLSLSNWRRFVANPTVVSLQKDFRNWNNPFPSATACFILKADKKLTESYISEKWNITPEDEKYQYYVDFVNNIANISYSSLQYLEKFANDTTFNNIDMTELAAKVHPHLSGTLLTFDTKKKTNWKLFMSELGICFSINTKFIDHFTFNVKGVNITVPGSDNTILKCHYLNGLCYARYDSDPLAPLKFYIHSYLEVIHVTNEPPLIVRESEEMEINYRMQETIASSELRYLTPSQRRCRFHDEPITEDLPVYSTSMCYITCRYKLAMKLCKCRPFFYQNMAGKVCNISGLMCLAKYAEYITKPSSELGCECPQTCHIITYLQQTYKVTKWEYGYFDRKITFRWGLSPPTTKYRRDVLFGFDDLVVHFGGTMALFFGISFISVIETIFLITESMLKNIFCLNKPTQRLIVKPAAKIKNENRINDSEEIIKAITNRPIKLFQESRFNINPTSK